MADQVHTQEEWRSVAGFEGVYEVSDKGRVRSLARTYRALRKGRPAIIPVPARFLSIYLTSGYPTVALTTAHKSTGHYIHRLVCAAWHGPQPLGCEVAHNDGNRLNPAPANLRWASRRDNLADKIAHGTQLRGDELWFTKVSDESVREIRKGNRSDESWAKFHGVSRSLIWAIRLRKRRATVSD